MSIFPNQKIQVWSSHALTAAVPAGAVNYLLFHTAGLQVAAFNLKMPIPGQLKSFQLNTIGAQPASGNLVIDLIVGATTYNIWTIAAGATPGNLVNDALLVSFVAGDVTRWTITNNAAAASLLLTAYTMLAQYY